METLNIADYGIEVIFTRLPRDETGKNPWSVPMSFHATVVTPYGTFTTPWTVGTGHARQSPYGNRKTIYEAKLLAKAIAKYKPVASDLIAHILAFSDCLDITFCEWAENLGMDNDSIKAKESYDLYTEQNMILRRAFGKDWVDAQDWAREQ